MRGVALALLWIVEDRLAQDAEVARVSSCDDLTLLVVDDVNCEVFSLAAQEIELVAEVIVNTEAEHFLTVQ